MLTSIDTPAVIVDLDVAERNIARFQDHCTRHGLGLRPHIKTHKLPQLAARQMTAGAVGITCQKIGEAEVMAQAGMTDIFITYNIVGEAKMARLRRLARGCRLSVVADNDAVVIGLSSGFADEPRPLEVLIECDTGAGRCGVQTPGEALALARTIAAGPGLRFGGLMTYRPSGDQAEVDRWLIEAREALRGEGLACPRISTGGSPNMWHCQTVTAATEHRAGVYVYNDRMQLRAGACTVEDCALSVLATVVSRPTATRAVLDAGSKVLTSDQFGLDGFGLVADHPEARVAGLSEEHGVLDLSATSWRPQVGDRVRVIPNHACVVSNMVDSVWAVRGTDVEGALPVAARGCVA
ncbi:MAG: D-TA family PLP-dependent enzyme [Rhodospirillaceae bacterium]|nr:D-TA family PLP-dependent enzyme [Rhodospirillaceae bacterium]